MRNRLVTLFQPQYTIQLLVFLKLTMGIAFVCKYSLKIYKGSLFFGEHFSIIYIGFIGFKERAIFSAELDSKKITLGHY